jgi:ubiquinone/menaquinone biosynthesis C-methylase UbiE
MSRNTSKNLSVEEMENIEIAVWEKLKDLAWLDNLSNKMSELRWLWPKFSLYDQHFQKAQAVLELGGGEGWASCVVKHLYPNAWVAASDISESAISSIGRWERVFEAPVDKRFACRSYNVPLPDNSVDLIFTFQAAHHFRLHEETMREVDRLLRPGGVCIYINEPSCRSYIYPLAKWRVNRKRPECPEDVCCVEHLQRAAQNAGFRMAVHYSTSTINRGPVEGVYYKILSSAPFLCSWLPCTADFVFHKV